MHYPFPSLFHGTGTHAYQILVGYHYQLGHMLVIFFKDYVLCILYPLRIVFTIKCNHIMTLWIIYM